MAASLLSVNCVLVAILAGGATVADATLRFTRHPTDSGGKLGETLSFRCIVEGDSGVVLRWQLRDTLLVGDVDRRTIESSATESGGRTTLDSTLTVSSLQVSDNGAVMCMATDTTKAVAASRKVALSVYFMNSDFRHSPSIVNGERTISIGDAVEMSCETPFSYPHPVVKWYRDGEEVLQDKRVATNRPADSSVSALTFTHVVPTDSGAYTCHASNLGGTVTSRSIPLSVTEPSGDYATVVVINPADVHTQVVGRPVEVACRAWGRPPPESVTWHTRAGKSIGSNNKFIARDQNLTIFPNRAGRTSRLAVCHANGTSSNTEETVTVHAANLPSLVALPPQDVQESTGATFNCTAGPKTYPSPNFKWQDPAKNEISSGIRRTIANGHLYSTLVINPVSLSDAGLYRCIALNPLTGNSTHTEAQLSVTRSIKSVRVAARDVQADINVIQRLPCEVQSGGMLEQVVWTQESNSISLGRHGGTSCDNCRVYVDIDGSLVFSLPKSQDAGRWQCTSPSSTVPWVTTNLTVVGKAYFTTKPSEILEVELNQTVEIICAADGIPTPSVNWNSRSNPPKTFSGGQLALHESIMTLVATNDYDNAVFRCIAGSSQGLSFFDVRLRVVSTPPTAQPSDDDSIVVTIAIVIPCAIVYILAMVVLVLWCQKRRYRLHRLSQEEEEASGGNQVDEENATAGQEMDNLQRKETLAPVAEAPPDYETAANENAPPPTVNEGVTASKAEEAEMEAQAPVAEERHHEPVRSKPPLAHLDEAELETAAANLEAPAEAAAAVAVVEPESPPVLHTPILFRAAEAHGIPFTSLSEVPRFKREQCKTNRTLGRGYFCTFTEVTNRYISGFAADTTMMMTKFSASSQDNDGYTRDILALASLRHKNIASCIAASSEKHPICILSEYYPQGDLKRLLLQGGSEADLHLQYHHQLSILLQLCDALQYLSARRFVHRDVATHSCLVNSSYQVKLAFYSRSDEGYPEDYYADVEGEEPLPIRWMSPGTIHSKEFTIQNDIWSFGVLMWEIFSAGKQPYNGTPNDDLCDLLEAGLRLPKPDGCPEAAFKTMQRCWEKEPKERLHFSQLGTRLHQLSSTSDL